MYKKYFKRVLDFCAALVILVAIFPILLVIYIWLTIANRGAGALFIQPRPGLNNKIFKLIKFKTMTDQRDETGKLLPDGQRITKIGKYLRAASVDELPQLINVLKGEMSFVGPRPLLVDYLPLYTERQARRHDMKPGITGWAQVNGRNLCKLSKKFEFDVWYIDHCSVVLDFKILMKTVVNVLKNRDIGDGGAEMRNVDDLGFAERLRNMQK